MKKSLSTTLALIAGLTLQFSAAHASMPVEPGNGDYCNTDEEGCIRDNDRNGRQDNEDNVDSENDDGYSRDDEFYNEGDSGEEY